MADLDELLVRLAKDAALLNAYHEWEMPAPAPAEPINYASIADRIERAAGAIASLREALNPFCRIAEMTTDSPAGASVIVNVDLCRKARKALSPTQKPGNGE